MRTKKHIPFRDFILAWQTSDCIDEVAKKFDITYREAINLSSRLRRNRVPLKRYRNFKKPDYSELALYAKSLLREPEPSAYTYVEFNTNLPHAP